MGRIFKSTRSRLMLLGILAVFGLVFINFYASLFTVKNRLVGKAEVAKQLSSYIQSGQWPTFIDWERNVEEEVVQKNKQAIVDYTIDEGLQKISEDLLMRHKPDYGAIVTMNPETGQILSLASFSRGQEEKNFALVSSYPAASVLKMVTAGAAIDTEKANVDTIVPYNGRNHTLYRRDVRSRKRNRWTRYITLKKAFASSVNVFFGKLGLYHVGYADFTKYVERFRFNRKIPADFPLQPSMALVPQDDSWALVEASSGFTRDITMSPIQGALMAAAVVNRGVMMEPYLVNKITELGGKVLYLGEPKKLSQTMKKESAYQLMTLMKETVKRGTSRGAFRKLLRRKKYAGVEFGGKTGSLNGRNPRGRTDWFVGYMTWKNKKVAIASVTVHKKFWRIKSSQLASAVFDSYLSHKL